MAVAILNPQDFHHQHQPSAATRLISPRRFPNPSPSNHHRRRRPSKSPPKVPLMGQVKILNRGKHLNLSTPETSYQSEDPISNSAVPFYYYAGSAFSTSPPPSSLPMPSFCKLTMSNSDVTATSDLRRLLRLD
ncbi:hypothetical protein RJ641_006192 [Dillenia turbinata]|uniref:Uncharacterized protein n=1 Tax=Dillenia turbinata TaxID=194707 RepID=A0AAN8Z7B2_9MAGN